MSWNVYDRNQARDELLRVTISLLIQRAENSASAKYSLPSTEEIDNIMRIGKVVVDKVFETYPPIDTSPSTPQRELPIGKQ